VPSLRAGEADACQGGAQVSAQPSDFDKDATSDEGIWRECAERLRIAVAAESENRIKGIEALKFRWGEQWDADVRNTRKIDGRPALTINHTNTFCARLENTLRQQRPRIKCHPVGDGANVDTAATVNGLIRHIEDRSKASVAYDTGVTSSLNIGWGYWRICSEYLDPMSFDQELLIKPVRNTFTVYMWARPDVVHRLGDHEALRVQAPLSQGRERRVALCRRAGRHGH
jgi:hypothetical protein